MRLIRREAQEQKRGGFPVAAGLTAGLALVAACNSQTPANPPVAVGKAETPASAPASQSGPAEHGALEGDKAAVGETKTVVYRHETRTVKRGSKLFTAEFLAEKTGVFAFQVSKVDEKGIEFSSVPGAAEGDQRPLRINYGEEHRIGEAVLFVSIKAVRGNRNSAEVELLYPVASVPLRPPSPGFVMPAEENARMSRVSGKLRIKCENVSLERAEKVFPREGVLSHQHLGKGGRLVVGGIGLEGLDNKGVEATYGDSKVHAFLATGTLCTLLVAGREKAYVHNTSERGGLAVIAASK